MSLMGQQLPRRSLAVAAAIPLITDTKMGGRRGRNGPIAASEGGAKARSAVPTKPFREIRMSRYRRLKIEGGAFFYTLALADRGSDLLGRVLINSAQCPLRSKSDRLVALPRSDAVGQEPT